MERLNNDGQWIVLMGILVSIGLFFLAFVINQSALVGQTTAEGVLEFPKNEIQDTRSEIFSWASCFKEFPSTPSGLAQRENQLRSAINDISTLSRYRRNAEVWFKIENATPVSGNYYFPITIHYNNGVTVYDETLTYFVSGI